MMIYWRSKPPIEEFIHLKDEEMGISPPTTEVDEGDHCDYDEYEELADL